MQLVKGDQIAVLDVKPQTYIITFSSRKLPRAGALLL